MRSFAKLRKIIFKKEYSFRNIDATCEKNRQISRKTIQKNISPHLNCAFSLVSVFKLVFFKKNFRQFF